jgi:type II secretory pathway pseudopilin PulG
MRYFHSLLRIGTILGNKKWVTIVELMVVLAILGLGITALLQTIGWGINYTRDTENKIKAINIAREGIEGMSNIRDTNWLRFSSDKVNCWKVDRYDSGCIGNSAFAGILWTGSYILYSLNGIWFLSGTTTIPYDTSWISYKNTYQVSLDSNGFYTQTGSATTQCTSFLQINCKTLFTRELFLSIPNPGTQTGVLAVRSIVRWTDGRPQNVILETTLTNWRSNF